MQKLLTYLIVFSTTTALTVANSTPEMSTSAPKSINIIHLSVGPSELGIGIDPKNHLVKSLDRGDPNFKIIYLQTLLEALVRVHHQSNHRYHSVVHSAKEKMSNLLLLEHHHMSEPHLGYTEKSCPAF